MVVLATWFLVVGYTAGVVALVEMNKQMEAELAASKEVSFWGRFNPFSVG